MLARLAPSRSIAVTVASITPDSAPRHPALIAEIKCASPSKGLLAKDFDPLRLAETYRQNGASAISILTDERYFRGHLDYLSRVAAHFAAGGARLPLLRKDFICDPYRFV